MEDSTIREIMIEQLEAFWQEVHKASINGFPFKKSYIDNRLKQILYPHECSCNQKQEPVRAEIPVNGLIAKIPPFYNVLAVDLPDNSYLIIAGEIHLMSRHEHREKITIIYDLLLLLPAHPSTDNQPTSFQ